MKFQLKLLIASVVFIMLVGAGIALIRFYILKDYQIVFHVECDPSLESCFVEECDSTVEECSENAEENITYYKIVEKSAANILECAPGDECEEPTCEPGEMDCAITLCSQEAAEAAEVMCSDNLEEPTTEEEESQESDLGQGEADTESTETTTE